MPQVGHLRLDGSGSAGDPVFLGPNKSGTVDGRNPLAPPKKPRKTIVGSCRIIIRGLLGWCEMDFVHPL